MTAIPVILGPTASGKSELALRLAERWGAEILSVDSMKVYRGMDIGTAKPDAATLARAPHHLIDILDPDQSYSSYDFYDDACRILGEAAAQGRRVVLEGGSALYFHALFAGICRGPEADWEYRNRLEEEAEASGDPELLHKRLAAVDAETAARLHPNDWRRIIRALEVHEATGSAMSRLQAETTQPAPFDFKVLGLEWPRDVLYARINARVDAMLEAGLLEEVRDLTARFDMSREAMQGLGYKELVRHLRGDLNFDEARALIQQKTRNFAKHQLTWFRGWDRIHRVEAEGKPVGELEGLALEYFKSE